MGARVGWGRYQLVINIYLVSYWKENLHSVCHPLVQVVGLLVAKHWRGARKEDNLFRSDCQQAGI